MSVGTPSQRESLGSVDDTRQYRNIKGSGVARVYSLAVSENSKLVFNRYDDQYFLSQVWTSGNSYGRGLFKSSRERSLGREMAKKGAEYQTVAIIGRKQ